MKVIEGKTRFGRKILFLGSGKLEYREGDRTHQIIPVGDANLYYRGEYTITPGYDSSGGTLRLYSDKDLSDVIKFLLSEKKFQKVGEYDIETIYVYNPQKDTNTEIQIQKKNTLMQ